MSFTVEGLTEEGSEDAIAEALAFQMRQSIQASCRGASHESVSAERGCKAIPTRHWFEWANAMFVILVEHALGQTCDAKAARDVYDSLELNATQTKPRFYENKFRNSHLDARFYVGVEARIKHNGD